MSVAVVRGGSNFMGRTIRFAGAVRQALGQRAAEAILWVIVYLPGVPDV